MIQRRSEALKDDVAKALEGDAVAVTRSEKRSRRGLDNAKDADITKECEAKLADLLPTAIEKASGRCRRHCWRKFTIR